jgi:glycosyltransferase involved in cell wall biosynthesis
LKVLQVISSSATSGAERHACSLSQQLIQLGHEVEVIVPSEGWLPDLLRSAHVPVHVSPMRGRGWYRTLGLILRMQRRGRFDIVHTHLTRAAYLGYAANNLMRAPIITSVHIANNDPIYKRLARRRNRLVAVSNFVRGMLHGRGIHERYIDTVYNGTDFHDIEVADPLAVKDEFGIPHERRMIGIIGRVCKEKGHLEMVHAMKDIRREHPEAHMMFVGRVEETFAEEFHSAVNEAGVADRLTLAGVRNDVPRILDSLTLSSMPSHIETFGVAAIEAMARGKAVVASKVGGLPEVVQHGRTGLLIDLRPEALAEAVNFLLEHDSERESMGRLGRLTVERKFTTRVMAKRFEAVYSHALGKPYQTPLEEDMEDLIKS